MKFLRNVLMVFAVLQLVSSANAGWGSAAYYSRNNGFSRGDNDAAKAYFATSAATTGLGTAVGAGLAAREYRDERFDEGQYDQAPRVYRYGYGRVGYRY